MVVRLRDDYAVHAFLFVLLHISRISLNCLVLKPRRKLFASVCWHFLVWENQRQKILHKYCLATFYIPEVLSWIEIIKIQSKIRLAKNNMLHYCVSVLLQRGLGWLLVEIKVARQKILFFEFPTAICIIQKFRIFKIVSKLKLFNSVYYCFH